MEKVRALMNGIRIPQHYDKVYKDECVITFDTPFREGGLCVNLKSWLGFSTDTVDVDIKHTDSPGMLYLLQKFRRVPKAKPESAEKEPTKMAIGLEGGFLEEKWDTVKEYALLVVDEVGTRTVVPLPCEELPMIVTSVCDAIIAHAGVRMMEGVQQWEDDTERKVSKFAENLIQLPPSKRISPNPKDWVCEKSGDTQNLWLNLSDGYIGGGRKFWDGSGGSNGALDHFNEELSKGNHYPLVVKLGTITSRDADVFSYDPSENNMVTDPKLAEHLAHWGIDIMKMEKTDKTMAEMEIDYNINYDWSRICEPNAVRMRGPGRVGIKNIGNSCYMNSTLQLLLGLPEASARYLDGDYKIRSRGLGDAPNDLITQVSKITNALMTDRYAPPIEEGEDDDDPRFVIAPQMFRTLIGRNHKEFSSNHQQDAAEFLQYFQEQLSRAEHSALGTRLPDGSPLSKLFEFVIEERFVETGLSSTGRVEYRHVQENLLGLPVELDDAENLAEVTAHKALQAEAKESDLKKAKMESEPEEPKPLILLQSCLARFAAPTNAVPFRGSMADKTHRIATMPRYLLVQVRRFFRDEQWMPSKLNCKVPMPDKLNLEQFRGTGRQPGESEWPDSDVAPAAAVDSQAASQMVPDAAIVREMEGMGICSGFAAKRAALAVQNASLDLAVSWFFDHVEDADINDPLPDGNGGSDTVDAESVAMLTSMGFSVEHVKAVLKNCGGNVERAADWLFSHDDLDAAVAQLSGGGRPTAVQTSSAPCGKNDGCGEYSLVGFISHIGKNASHGHYVCHMRRGPDAAWFAFDDSKVAKSEDPPKDLGYIYLYARDDSSSAGSK